MLIGDITLFITGFFLMYVIFIDSMVEDLERIGRVIEDYHKEIKE